MAAVRVKIRIQPLCLRGRASSRLQLSREAFVRPLTSSVASVDASLRLLVRTLFSRAEGGVGGGGLRVETADQRLVIASVRSYNIYGAAGGCAARYTDVFFIHLYPWSGVT